MRLSKDYFLRQNKISEEELSSPEGVVSLSQAEEVGLTLSPELQLLSSPCITCCSCPKTSHPVEEAPSLAFDSLDA